MAWYDPFLITATLIILTFALLAVFYKTHLEEPKAPPPSRQKDAPFEGDAFIAGTPAAPAQTRP